MEKIDSLDSMLLCSMLTPGTSESITRDLFSDSLSLELCADVLGFTGNPTQSDLKSLFLRKNAEPPLDDFFPRSEEEAWSNIALAQKRSRNNQLAGVIHGIASSIAGTIHPLELEISKAINCLVEETRSKSSEVLTFGELQASAIEVKSTQLPTGYGTIDKNFGGGMSTGRHYVVAAYSGTGKSFFAMRMAARISQKSPVAYFSLEMNSNEIYQRLSSLDLNKDQFYTGVGAFSLSEIIKNVIVLHKTKHIKAVFVDYVGLVSSNGLVNDPSQSAILIDYVKGLSAVCRRFNICLVSVAQMRKPAIKDRVASIHDIKDASELVHDADAVLILRKESAAIEISCEKNRHGPSFSFSVFMDKMFTGDKR